MKTSCFIFLLLTLVFLVKQSDAAFVSYKDKSGKIHYVNTDYTKVPDEYLKQVEEQLKKIEDTKAKFNPPGNFSAPTTPFPTFSNASNQANPAYEPEISAQVYIKRGCDDCMRLRVLLDAHKIKYSMHDIEASTEGMEFYKNMQNAPLPITRIGPKVIFGIDINAIKNAMNPIEPLSQSTPSGLPSANEQISPKTAPGNTGGTNSINPYFNTGHLPGKKQ